jgi:hypothetical protein
MAAASKHVGESVATVMADGDSCSCVRYRLTPSRYPALFRGHIGTRSNRGRRVMNAVIRKVTGTYSVVQFVADDKLDALATLLGLDETQKAQLKANGPTIVVLDDDGKSAG